MSNALIHSRHRRARRISGLLLCVLAGALMFLPLATRAQPSSAKEYQIKAAFLYNFSQFVDWPTNTFSDAQSPLVIGIIGDDPFGGYLDELVKGEKINNHPLAVQHYHDAGEIKDCHILFVSASEAARLAGILDSLKGRDILTVGDMNGFARDGGMIRFITENGKIRFRVCVETAKAAHLTISSKLLRSAEIVQPGKD
ncbi:MAG TPA: YfiR family protein [Verrucomicrobiae bacterium]|nr:YfiR family protein [Verrucomicrobiae bacterium]